MRRELTKRWFFLAIGILLFSSFSAPVLANDLTHRLGIGLGWPYLSLKYGIVPNFSIEARGAAAEGIGAYGLRGYYNFNPYDRCVIFTGLGANYVNFSVPADDDDGEDISGSGYTASIFVGGEYFINDNFTLTTDIGPTYISLTEREFDLNVGGIEFVANIGINFYFGSSRQFEDKPSP